MATHGYTACHACVQVVKFSLSSGERAHQSQRQFFLFDNVLIYCKGGNAEKKSGINRLGSSFRGRSFDKKSLKGRSNSLEQGKGDGTMEGLVFKGRIPTSNLTFMNLEDGKGYVQTNGNAVEFAFKISNEAKGKW